MALMKEMEIGWDGEREGETRSGAVRRKVMLSELSERKHVRENHPRLEGEQRGRELKYPFIFSSFRRNRGSNIEL